ncbi:MAG: type II secretion system secretin GspD [Pseudomonas sp.]|uniref:type II secretion system secretin GspD n=1 Tax=Pseudomonas sp. TaxID=306 RepID=UPI003394C665
MTHNQRRSECVLKLLANRERGVMKFRSLAGRSVPRFPLSLICVAMLLSACNTMTKTEPERPAPSIVKTNAVPPPASDELPVEAPQKGRVLLEQRGSGNFVGAQARSSAPVTDGVNVNFENAPLADVLGAVLGDMLGVAYSLEGNIGGNVTLVSSKPVPRDALLSMLESMLEAQGIAMVRGANGIYRVGPSAQLKREVPVGRLEASSQAGYSVRIVPLQYLSALEAQKVLTPLGMKDSILHVDPVRNILLLGASGPQMQNALRTLQMLDVDLLKGMSFGIYEVVNLDAKEIVARFNEVLANPKIGALTSAKLVAMPELNSVMVVAPQADQLDTVRSWLTRLDTLGRDDDQAGEQMYVYNVQNGEAKVLAQLLGQIFGGTTSDATPSTSGETAPGLGQSDLSSSDGLSSSSSDTSGSSLGSFGNDSSKQAGVSSTTTKNGTRIVADEGNNSLLVMATAKEWRSIRSAIEKMDKTPSQVLVEVSIWEVTLTDTLNYGVEWFFNNKGGFPTTGANRTIPQTGGLGSFGNNLARAIPGFSYVFSGSDWRAVINTLAANTEVKTLSSPSILVLDNQEAKIQVGDQQPIQTSSTISGSDLSTQNFQLKDTGVLLKVKPRVNAGGLVIMEIAQEVTDIGPPDDATGQRSFKKRSIESSVAIQSGDTIILGGLIEDKDNGGNSGIPYLRDMPLLGPLFGATKNEGKRTELLVTISPRAVTQYKDFDRIGEDFRQKMGGVTEAFREEFEAQK